MPDGGNINDNNLVFLFDGTFEGLLCCVFYAYENKKFPREVVTAEYIQQSLTDEYITIETEQVKATRVYDGLTKNVSYNALYSAYTAFLADEIDKKNTYVFNYIVLAFKYKRKVESLFQDENVIMVAKMIRRVTWEKSKMLGFARFEELHGGLYYCECEPTNNLLELMAAHFADRLHNQKWIIWDKKRNLCAVYNTREWVITSDLPHDLPERSEREQEYQRLWQGFFDAITIEGRKNPKLQRQLMPKKYWKYLKEMHNK